MCMHLTQVRRGDIWWHAFPHNAELATMSPTTIGLAVNLTHALDARFGLERKAVLSQRDVPGLPRPAIPVLKDAGVRALSIGANGAVVPPNVPPAFIWRDGGTLNGSDGGTLRALTAAAGRAGLVISPPSLQEVLVLFHGYGAVAARHGNCAIYW